MFFLLLFIVIPCVNRMNKIKKKKRESLSSLFLLAFIYLCVTLSSSLSVSLISHPIAAGLHVTQLLCEETTGLALTPVGCSVERSPAVPIFSRHIQATLTQQPETDRDKIHLDIRRGFRKYWKHKSKQSVCIYIYKHITILLFCAFVPRVYAVQRIEQLIPALARAAGRMWPVPQEVSCMRQEINISYS